MDRQLIAEPVPTHKIVHMWSSTLRSIISFVTEVSFLIIWINKLPNLAYQMRYYEVESEFGWLSKWHEIANLPNMWTILCVTVCVV